MRKIVFYAFACLLSLLVPASLFAAPKKKGGAAAGGAEISCAKVWNKSPDKFYGKTVKTFVLDLGDTGTVRSDAPFAVVPVKTGDAGKASGGNVLVLVPAKDFPAFCEKYAPKTQQGQASKFGAKVEYRALSGTFAKAGGENVLLVGVPAGAAKNLSPSEALRNQRGSDGDAADESSREGFEKKIFSVSRLGEKEFPAAEFKRLLTLYNRGKSGAARMREKEVREFCEEDDEFFLTVFDEKAKIEWEIRR